MHHEPERRSRDLGDQESRGAALEPQADRSDLEEHAGAPEEPGPEHEAGVGVVAQQHLGDRGSERDDERRRHEAEHRRPQQPGAEAALRVRAGDLLLVLLVVVLVVAATERPADRARLGREAEDHRHQGAQEEQQAVAPEVGRPEEPRDDADRRRAQACCWRPAPPPGPPSSGPRESRGRLPHRPGARPVPARRAHASQIDQLAKSRPTSSRRRSASSRSTRRASSSSAPTHVGPLDRAPERQALVQREPELRRQQPAAPALAHALQPRGEAGGPRLAGGRVTLALEARVREAGVDPHELEHLPQGVGALAAEVALLQHQDLLAVVVAQELLELHEVLAADQVGGVRMGRASSPGRPSRGASRSCGPSARRSAAAGRGRRRSAARRGSASASARATPRWCG